MKKIISRIAFIGVAAMALLTSCVTEDIETSFDLADATCTVTVKVLYALDQSDITSKATISSKYGSGPTITIPATNKTIDGQTLTVTVSLPGTDYTDSKDINIATILPGGVGTYSVVFVFGSIGDIQYKAEKINDGGYADFGTTFLKNTHYSHADDQSGWLYNDSEFILTGEVTYELWSGCEIIDSHAEDDEAAKVQEFVNAIVENDPLTKTPQVLNITVSAWAAYKVYQTLTANMWMYNVLKRNVALGTDWEEVGDFSYYEYNGCAANFEEKANPGHAAHYHAGHGLDSHGTTNNAGGGIVLGE